MMVNGNVNKQKNLPISQIVNINIVIFILILSLLLVRALSHEVRVAEVLPLQEGRIGVAQRVDEVDA